MRWLSLRPDADAAPHEPDADFASGERDAAARGDLPWALVGTALRLAAEAGFIATLYAAAAVLLVRSEPLLGPIEFVMLVALGAAVGYVGQERPELGAPALIIAVLGGGVAGWLASPIARELLSGHLGAALVTHGIGWMGAFAVLRGAVIRGGASGAQQLEALLRTLLPSVALVWAVTTLLVQRSLWPSFAAYALWGSLALIVAGLAGIGLIRLRMLHSGVQEIRVRRLWRWLVLAAAISVVPLAMPFAILAGVPIDVLLAPLGGPAKLIMVLAIIPFAILVDILIRLFAPVASSLADSLDGLRDDLLNNQRSQLEPAAPSIAATVIGVALAAAVILVIVVAVYLLARWMLRREEVDSAASEGSTGVVLEHAIVVPAPARARPRNAARRRRVAAHDAVSAYVNAVDELAAHPAWARAEDETPAEHSLRLREAEMPGSVELSRLAADYQLARYAERPITALEDRRALSRLTRLRRALRA